MKIYRLWSFRLRRAINLCWRFYNLIKLNTYGINHGKHTVIHGHFGLYLAENAFVRIGDFFIVLAESILIRYAVIYKPILPLIKMQFYV